MALGATTRALRTRASMYFYIAKSLLAGNGHVPNFVGCFIGQSLQAVNVIAPPFSKFNLTFMAKELQYAHHPLTLFDGMFHSAGVVAGWFVEGLLDLRKVDHALSRLVTKWPMLAGRLERTGKKLGLTVRVPLGPLPPTYVSYSLTSKVSNKPITDYVKLPLPASSGVLPAHLFLNPTAPQNPHHWSDKDIPLTYWHLTYFKAQGLEYTCIGVTFSHGLLDGMGIAAVIHALEAESLGRPWSIPPSLEPGINGNKMQSLLDKTRDQMEEEGIPLPADYRATSVVGWWFFIMFLWWHIWQQFWHKAQRRMILMPPQVYEKLVRDSREAMKREGKTDVRLSTGDVIAAWIYKTIYSQETSPSRLVQLSNMASLRMFSDASLNHYPHNCFIPIGYPIFTIAQLKTIRLHHLAYELAKAKAGLSLGHAVHVYKLLEESTKPSRFHKSVMPYDARADETLVMSNMSIARVVDINWTGLGGKRTVCRYKANLCQSSVLISNVVTITGRLHDGSTVLDVILNRRRRQLLEMELEKLIVDATAESDSLSSKC